MKKILGLDIGTNSIGWAMVAMGEFGKTGRILGLGSRIIPMDGDALQKFESGNTVSKTADRRMARTVRRMKQRFKLRRTRLIQALKTLGWIPGEFPLDFRQPEMRPFVLKDYLPFESATIEEARRAFSVEALPEDWIVYYLRRKALYEKISLADLARIIYMMNQRRGFRSSRKDQREEDDINEVKYPIYEKWVQILPVTGIAEISEEKGIKTLEIKAGDLTGQIKRKNIPDWSGKEIELEITKKTIKSGEVTVSFALPDPNDWEKKKKALEENIKDSGYYAGEYFFHQLVLDKQYRIRQRIIDRTLYRQELDAIWQKQATFHPALNDTAKLPEIATMLYKHNVQKQNELIANDLLYLFANDIIYYQRPLKSQKHRVDRCTREYKEDDKGNKYGVRVAPKSSPEFQEFRIWQQIHNLKILEMEGETDGKPQLDVDRTELYLRSEQKAKLFDLFDGRAAVSSGAILKELGLAHRQFRLNYPEEKEFPGNETKAVFRKVFRKHGYTSEGENLLNDPVKCYLLWHILYSLNDAKDIVSALKNAKHGFGLTEEVIYHLSKLPDLPKQYAAFSSKALRKMLPLMRCGKYFSPDAIGALTREKIEKILDGELDSRISDDLREMIKKLNLKTVEDFQGSATWLADFILYDKYASRENNSKYEFPDDINIPELIPNNSLRNPVVEQIIKETLGLVKEVWTQYGQPDEIHLELARELKKTADERKKIDDRNKANEADRKRIRAILRALKNANPDSVTDMERIRLWEETGNEEARTNAIKFSKEPTSAEIERYKLWGEQNHMSPYTGKVIPLSKLFTPEYEIEHIIPRARFFDNSFLNKTICESSVNKFKDKLTARQLIEASGGETISNNGNTFTLLDASAYFDHCKRIFRGGKYRNLMREDIPKDFVQRQINDTRYITRKLAELLYPIAKDKEGIIFTIGSITSEMKEKWGLNHVWKELLRPRFERLQVITGESLIDFDPANNSLHFKKDYKRVDHRHHALDALIITCTTREHIRYLNTLHAAEEASKYKYLVKSKYSSFVLPWETFTKEAKEQLGMVIVSHKNRNRLVSKAVNKITKWKMGKDGKWSKHVVPQVKGELLAVRKSMFKEPLGKITLREYKEVSIKQALEMQFQALKMPDKTSIPQVADTFLRKQLNELIRNCGFDLKETEKHLKKYPLKDMEGNILAKLFVTQFNTYAAKRVTLDKSFTVDKIAKIPNAEHSWLARLLLQHLETYNSDPNEAFRGEALEALNKKAGKPINKVTVYEEIGKKVDFNGKLVEGDKGTNLFFVIYEKLATGERVINEDSAVPLLTAITRLANKWPIAEQRDEFRPIVLSPNDLVYVPEPGEEVSTIDWMHDKARINNRIYKVVSFTKAQCFFIPHFVSRPLDDNAQELGSNNKAERAWDGQMIKNVCVKIRVDKLGNITEVNGKKIYHSSHLENAASNLTQ